MWFDLWFYCDVRNFKFQNCDFLTLVWSNEFPFWQNFNFTVQRYQLNLHYVFQPVKVAAFHELFEPVKVLVSSYFRVRLSCLKTNKNIFQDFRVTYTVRVIRILVWGKCETSEIDNLGKI